MSTPTALPAPVAGDTKRSYLVRHGLAKEGARGQFPKAGKEALAAYPDFVWADVVPAPAKPKAEKTVTAPVQAAAPAQSAPAVVTAGAETASFNAKDVRVWAKENGVAVGQRGRIHPSVIAQFVKAGGKPTGPKAATVRPTPLDMPKVRPQSTGYSVVGGILIRQDRCGNGHAVNRCACNADGTVPAHKFLDKIAGGPVVLTLDKPAL